MSKKTWSRPELVILARSKPEEAVLTHCKRIDLFAGGENENQSGCGNDTSANCGACQSRSGS